MLDLRLPSSLSPLASARAPAPRSKSRGGGVAEFFPKCTTPSTNGGGTMT